MIIFIDGEVFETTDRSFSFPLKEDGELDCEEIDFEEILSAQGE